MDLGKKFIKDGFQYIQKNEYLSSQKEIKSLKILSKYFNGSLKNDGPRQRAYLKLEWDRSLNHIQIANNQSYFQTETSNTSDGGKRRQFEKIPEEILDLDIIKKIITVNQRLIEGYEPLKKNKNLIMGLHFIRYHSKKMRASYSSPVGLHKDDEPLVFIHLVELSPESLGGDNLIAELETQTITHVIRLEKAMETIVLNNNCYHAVTPLGSKKGNSKRDIILFTIEPEQTQYIPKQ